MPAQADLPGSYGQALAQRNEALRRVRANAAGRESVAPWTQRVAELGAELDAARAALVAGLSPVFAARAETLGLPDATLVYEPDPPTVEALEARFDRDVLRGTTSLGPHLRDVGIEADGRELRSFGSQGEQRATVLALDARGGRPDRRAARCAAAPPPRRRAQRARRDPPGRALGRASARVADRRDRHRPASAPARRTRAGGRDRGHARRGEGGMSGYHPRPLGDEIRDQVATPRAGRRDRPDREGVAFRRRRRDRRERVAGTDRPRRDAPRGHLLERVGLRAHRPRGDDARAPARARSATTRRPRSCSPRAACPSGDRFRRTWKSPLRPPSRTSCEKPERPSPRGSKATSSEPPSRRPRRPVWRCRFARRTTGRSDTLHRVQK